MIIIGSALAMSMASRIGSKGGNISSPNIGLSTPAAVCDAENERDRDPIPSAKLPVNNELVSTLL
jgi:hypothetical protein